MPDDDLLQILFETLPPGIVRAPAPVAPPAAAPGVAGLADVPTMDDVTEDSEPDTERTPPTVLATSGRARASIEPMIPPQRPRRNLGIRPNAALVKGIPSIAFEEPSMELPPPPVFQAPAKAAVVEKVSVRTQPPREPEPLPVVEPTARLFAREPAPSAGGAGEAKPAAASQRSAVGAPAAAPAVARPVAHAEPVAVPAGPDAPVAVSGPHRPSSPDPAARGAASGIDLGAAAAPARAVATPAPDVERAQAPRAADQPKPELVKKTVGRPVDSPRVRSGALSADFLDDVDPVPSSPAVNAQRVTVVGVVAEAPAAAPVAKSGIDWRAAVVVVSLGVVLCVLLLLALQQDLQAIR